MRNIMIQIKVILKVGMIQRNYFRKKVAQLECKGYFATNFIEVTILDKRKRGRMRVRERKRERKEERNDIPISQYNKWLYNEQNLYNHSSVNTTFGVLVFRINLRIK